MPVIDVHAHLYDERYLEELGRILASPSTGVEQASAKQYARTMGNPANWDVDERIGTMERIGLEYQVLSLSIPMSYDGDSAARLRLAQGTNDRFAEVLRTHSKHFFAFATLPLPDVDASLKELERCFEELGFVGACFGSNIRGMRLDHPDFAPVFEEMDRRGSTAFLHPNIPVCSGPDTADFNISSGLAYVYDTGVTVYRMIMSGMLERYRQLSVIVPHLGGMLPYLTGRLDGGMRHTPGMAKPPSAYMAELYYDTVSQHQPALRLAKEQFGAEHLMLGSDYPLGSSPLEDSVQFVRDADFTPAERDLVLGGNA
ncbi:MAG TPA: amidohydrolase family protein, partial [Chloroflexota bacterium]|nr:amidohydrolase family protein [Chloroflexota bacterium]